MASPNKTKSRNERNDNPCNKGTFHEFDVGFTLTNRICASIFEDSGHY